MIPTLLLSLLAATATLANAGPVLAPRSDPAAAPPAPPSPPSAPAPPHPPVPLPVPRGFDFGMVPPPRRQLDNRQPLHASVDVGNTKVYAGEHPAAEIERPSGNNNRYDVNAGGVSAGLHLGGIIADNKRRDEHSVHVSGLRAPSVITGNVKNLDVVSANVDVCAGLDVDGILANVATGELRVLALACRDARMSSTRVSTPVVPTSTVPPIDVVPSLEASVRVGVPVDVSATLQVAPTKALDLAANLSVSPSVSLDILPVATPSCRCAP